MTREPRKAPPLRFVPLLLAAVGVILVGILVLCEKQLEITLGVPVKLERVPQDLIVLRGPPVVEATLKGPARIVEDVEECQVVCRIDLAGAEPGPLFIPLSFDMIETPSRVSVLHLDPESLTLSVEKRTEKKVPVVADMTHDPASQYTVSRVLTEPSMVSLTGPASVLGDISAVRTTPIDIGGLTETIKKTVALNLNHNPHVQALGGNLVEVEIVVEEKTVDKHLSLPVRTMGGPFRAVVTPDRIQVLLRGPANTLKKLTEDDGVKVYVDVEGLGPGTYVRRAVIEPPLDTTLMEATPEVFTVKILNSEQRTVDGES